MSVSEMSTELATFIVIQAQAFLTFFKMHGITYRKTD